MGIDAEMLIRNVPTATVTDEWLKDISWRFCRAIGSKHFFISDGLPPAEYEAKNKAWHEAFDAHPLYPEYKAKVDAGADKKEVHEKIFADVGESPKRLRLAVGKTLRHYRDADTPPEGSEYHQDGDTIKANDGECLLEVAIYGRYYGEGYERGDILTYCAMAEWLEANIPGCTIWYGGDSSGVEADPFDEKRRKVLRNHLYSERGRDYFNHTLTIRADDITVRPPACGMCPKGLYHGNRHGWGQNYAAYNCPGCGKSVKTQDGGKTWQEDDRE